MSTDMPTREERADQLRQLAASSQGKREVERLYFACFPPGTLPPIGSRMIETILSHEYPPDDATGRGG